MSLFIVRNLTYFKPRGPSEFAKKEIWWTFFAIGCVKIRTNRNNLIFISSDIWKEQDRITIKEVGYIMKTFFNVHIRPKWTNWINKWRLLQDFPVSSSFVSFCLFNFTKLLHWWHIHEFCKQLLNGGVLLI